MHATVSIGGEVRPAVAFAHLTTARSLTRADLVFCLLPIAFFLSIVSFV